jgi:hypothetical protein
MAAFTLAAVTGDRIAGHATDDGANDCRRAAITAMGRVVADDATDDATDNRTCSAILAAATAVITMVARSIARTVTRS